MNISIIFEWKKYKNDQSEFGNHGAIKTEKI